MTELIKELEKYQAQFFDYGGTLLKVMLRKEKERDHILRYLIKYLEKNPKVSIINVRQEASVIVPMEVKGDEEKNTMIAISFLCDSCGTIVKEEIALSCTWIPRKTDTELICTNCSESYDDADDSYDAAQEEKYLAEKDEEVPNDRTEEYYDDLKRRREDEKE